MVLDQSLGTSWERGEGGGGTREGEGEGGETEIGKEVLGGWMSGNALGSGVGARCGVGGEQGAWMSVKGGTWFGRVISGWPCANLLVGCMKMREAMKESTSPALRS